MATSAVGWYNQACFQTNQWIVCCWNVKDSVAIERTDNSKHWQSLTELISHCLSRKRRPSITKTSKNISQTTQEENTEWERTRQRHVESRVCPCNARSKHLTTFVVGHDKNKVGNISQRSEVIATLVNACWRPRYVHGHLTSMPTLDNVTNSNQLRAFR